MTTAYVQLIVRDDSRGRGFEQRREAPGFERSRHPQQVVSRHQRLTARFQLARVSAFTSIASDIEPSSSRSSVTIGSAVLTVTVTVVLLNPCSDAVTAYPPGSRLANV